MVIPKILTLLIFQERSFSFVLPDIRIAANLPKHSQSLAFARTVSTTLSSLCVSKSGSVLM